MHKLAIVIPYYKINFFEETLKSVASQSNRNFTLYIGNDASPNDPLPLIKKHLGNLSYFYFDYSENLGGKNLTLQWERVLETVKEDWFQILGDDDVISENFVEAFYQKLEEIDQSGINVIKYTQCWINDQSELIRKYTAYPKLMSSWENWSRKYIYGDQSSLSEHIFRMSAYNEHGFVHLPLAWGTDDLAILELADGKPVYFIDSADVKVRISNENISGKIDNQDIKKTALLQLNRYLISNYLMKLPKSYLLNAADKEVRFSYEEKKTSVDLNLFQIYLNTGEYLRLLKLPLLYYRLYVNKKHFVK